MEHFSHEVIPGGLASADHERIFDLAGRGFGAQRIARAISKHPSTVQWFMHRNGLRPLQRRESPLAYRRGNIMVRRFTRAEDELIQQLRIAGDSLSTIAAKISERFGYTRGVHSIHCRLVMLGAHEEA